MESEIKVNTGIDNRIKSMDFETFELNHSLWLYDKTIEKMFDVAENAT